MKHKSVETKNQTLGNPLDPRTWLRDVEALGELTKLQGADWNLELGAISELNVKKAKPPAMLFDEIPGYPKGFRVLIDLGKAAIPYQGLALIGRAGYLKQNPNLADAVLRGVLDAVGFVQNPARKDVVVKSLMRNLRLSDVREAESGYSALQWLYNLDVAPEITGIRNMQRLLAITINSGMR